MIIDLKYHIASLVAVFLALAMGILIGTTMLGSDAIIEQTKQMAQNLEQDLAKLRGENTQLTTKVVSLEKSARDYQQFGREILPQLISNRLQGVEVALVETSNYGFNEDLIKTLQSAGAKIHSTTTISPTFDLSDQAKKQQIVSFLGMQETKTEKVMSNLAAQVAQGIVVGDNIASLNYLEEQGLIKKSGEYGVPVNTVIIIGGSQEENTSFAQVVDAPMIAYFVSKGINVFGVEHRDVVNSYMRMYQKHKISTVDNVDTVPGEVALIWAMQGKPGDYGVKETAKSLLPR